MIDPVSHAAFEEFARARTPHLYRAAWLLCGHRAEAEDLVQETLAKVYVRMHRRQHRDAVRRPPGGCRSRPG